MTIALWCLFFAALLHILSKSPLFMAQVRTEKGYNNSNPRKQQNALTGVGQRALAAHQNQIESFPLFAAGVIVATMLKCHAGAVDILAIAYIVARCVYIYAYVKDIPSFRTAVFMVGYFSSVLLICAPAWADLF